MNPRSPLSDSRRPPLARGAGLSLVTSGLVLARPEAPAPEAWQAGLARLFGWLGIAADLRAPAEAPAAPVFAPWVATNPADFQLGGAPGLPRADFAASHLVEHARGRPLARGALDIALMSPHPAHCDPLPCPEVLAAMLRAARDEGRTRIAILCHARQCAALVALAGGEGQTVEILAIEDALPRLLRARAPWDAIIAMPEWRSTVFTLLGEANGLRRPWPMLWFAAEKEGGRVLRRVTCEAPGAGADPLPLDAPALVHALRLTLSETGAARAALRLHEAWARLRERGVTTAGSGAGDAPYASQVADAAFLEMLCREPVGQPAHAPAAPSKSAKTAISGAQNPGLRIVS